MNIRRTLVDIRLAMNRGTAASGGRAIEFLIWLVNYGTVGSYNTAGICLPFTHRCCCWAAIRIGNCSIKRSKQNRSSARQREASASLYMLSNRHIHHLIKSIHHVRYYSAIIMYTLLLLYASWPWLAGHVHSLSLHSCIGLCKLPAILS